MSASSQAPALLVAEDASVVNAGGTGEVPDTLPVPDIVPTPSSTLPGGWDRRLAWVLTTPGMHGIHHSADRAQRDSNWSSGFSPWDRLHGTLQQDVAQADLTIGVDDACAGRDVALLPALEAPFRPEDEIAQP